MSARRLLAAVALALLVGVTAGLCAGPALAQSLTFDLGDAGGTATGRIVQMVALITVLSLAPSILIMMTAFTRIVIVLSFLRNALGVQQVPPTTVMMSLALFLTFFVMAPVFERSYTQGIQPLINQEIDEVEAFRRTVGPLREFMLNHTGEKDLRLFMDMARLQNVQEPADTPLHVLVPAFMISEIKRGFEIGFLLFLPFLIIDMVVSSILMAMGMMMLPPTMVAIPFKIIFFVLVDGWYLIAGSLARSFGTL
ncbi:flagellar type III secretion system pore protein FliP [Azospirillum agricola]|uniref:flagellar type III secretion system pore protein FliP n=1 Tax=Azospirillum agricola TaxID=1720247 RepID=UPI000A0F29E1|nr:flagellar type III secretion system pore protein FliP [Azospirillum agricola]MBP2229319.1 flagellar biosynthetic protein FliP [Azospirillum agricola]SMH60400.1 flagellar biosynthetic protein FliP [Azospirillum lipoferum]